MDATTLRGGDPSATRRIVVAVAVATYVTLVLCRAWYLSGPHRQGRQSIFRLIGSTTPVVTLASDADVRAFALPVVRDAQGNVANHIRCSASGWSWNRAQFAQGPHGVTVRLEGDFARMYGVDGGVARMGGGTRIHDLVAALDALDLESAFVGNCYSHNESQQVGACVATNVHHTHTPSLSEIVTEYTLLVPEVAGDTLRLREVTLTRSDADFRAVAGSGGTTGIVLRLGLQTREERLYSCFSKPVIGDGARAPPSAAALRDYRRRFPDQFCMWISIDAKRWGASVNRWRTIEAAPVGKKTASLVKKRSIRDSRYSVVDYAMALAAPNRVALSLLRFAPNFRVAVEPATVVGTNRGLGITQDINHIEFEVGVRESQWDAACVVIEQMGLTRRLFVAVRSSPPVEHSYLGFADEWTVFVGFHRADRKLETHAALCRKLVRRLRDERIAVFVHLGKAGAETPADTIAATRADHAAFEQSVRSLDRHGVMRFRP